MRIYTQFNLGDRVTLSGRVATHEITEIRVAVFVALELIVRITYWLDGDTTDYWEDQLSPVTRP